MNHPAGFARLRAWRALLRDFLRSPGKRRLSALWQYGPWFAGSFRSFTRQLEGSASRGQVARLGLRPILGDRDAGAGEASGHYFWQDLYVAQRIFEANPPEHLDIGSRIDGFVAHVASFRRITVGDIRPLASRIPNVAFVQMDLMGELPPGQVGQFASVSCLHALEHFGLGRYGDPENADGHIAGLRNLQRLLRPGGVLYLAVPIGAPTLWFNAHRVFAPRTILDLAAPLALTDFAYIGDDGALYTPGAAGARAAELERLDYGCGIFTFRAAA
jgi:SAM-dependent methyltransferase